MQNKNNTINKPLGFFSLVMINVIAVDNLRSLTVGAEYGLALVFFYSLAALLFFIPTVLITAELAAAWPATGGVYVWVREAFGPRIGFFTIWLQWIYNVVWYPTIFAFIAGILAFLFHPALVDNKIYMLAVILIAFWGATIINCLDLSVSAILSIIGALIGTILPMLFIGGLGLFWIILGKENQIHFEVKNFFPSLTNINNLAFFTNILFGLMGMEMSAVHAGDVKNPIKNYPRALLLSAFIILITLIFASLAVAIVVPNKQLNLVSGLMDAFSIFLSSYHLNWLVSVMAIVIIIGSLSGAAAWIIGPTRGLLVAAQDNNLSSLFQKLNNKNMPIGILLIQGGIVTLLCAVFLIMPSVSSSYWVLSNLTAQLALVFYILFFAAAIRLRYKTVNNRKNFKIPGGLLGIWLVAGIGIVTCVGTIILGFLPPTQIGGYEVVKYEFILIFGMGCCCLMPLLLGKFTKIKVVTSSV